MLSITLILQTKDKYVSGKVVLFTTIPVQQNYSYQVKPQTLFVACYKYKIRFIRA